jgi:hypothetical protein
MACARPRGFPDLRARRLGKELGLERRAALGGAASGADAEEGGAHGVHDVAARRCSDRKCFAEPLFESEKLQIFE